ncbi:DUF2130 domain-containing protein [Candidatus Shapirobacteria bacterium CG_4_10_14_0_8_um_filter_39_15]|nr:MAG: DUF2130 domain-containing protein [Candidatus Shapirobacteria bacterium CG_4_10_14_0_8_um_filter_39_15]PJE68062.1 MAG: DUF2130 domain-containing protein [Candidatus Shapirobacteria bacterium CG10_big_fil_rev_8_21_14_0_10_38_8]
MDKIKCPNCGQLVEITEALKGEIRQESQAELEKELRIKISEENKTEILDLKKTLEEKDKKVEEMREHELELREEKRKLEERGKELALEVGRKIDEERKKIEETVVKQAEEEHRLKDLEKEKKITDLTRALEDATRKAQQGSQQTQGEVLELDLEESLKTNFKEDEILPVAKGEEGADIRQVVKSPKGIFCGTILWEVKRTKTWQDKWLTKLKDDLRAEKANIPVIVTIAFPKEMKSAMELIDGVWVCGYELMIPLAILLRRNLLDVTYQKLVLAQKTGKADLLYDYITGHEFKQQVEALVETYQEMREQIAKERQVLEKSLWVREEQIKRLMSSTAQVYGSVQGLAGSAMPEVKGLELQELESGK